MLVCCAYLVCICGVAWHFLWCGMCAMYGMYGVVGVGVYDSYVCGMYCVCM